ncbi:Tetrahydroberberine oxidase [Linum perenne]
MLKILSILLFIVTVSADQISHGDSDSDSILDCLHSTGVSQFTHLPTDSTYTAVLQSSIKNSRFNTTAASKPSIIVTPETVSHIQSTILCSKNHNFHLRIRSGGHDSEGLSYTSSRRQNHYFLLLDLVRFRNITIDDDSSEQTAWVQAAVTTGELYYRLAEKSPTLAFPSGICPTVGLGGQISGGGWGTLLRKYGLAADNVVDALLIDAEGRILDRDSMGEDLFWAIRGGGGNTFGIVVAWKIKLVRVPASVTACTVSKTLEQNATGIVHRWQYVADKLPDDVFFMVVLTNNATTIQASFSALFLGETEDLVPIMDSKFPELGLKKESCIEMSWARSILYFGGFPPEFPLESLLDRTISATGSAKFKGKSDYVKDPIPISGLEGIWEKLKEVDPQTGGLIMASYGGRMSEIPESSIPFPHRGGIIYQVEEVTFWVEDGEEAADRQINWLRGLYDYMAPYVSKNPREAYVNYRDLDIGDGGSYRRAKRWGSRYFKNNFDRLVRVKTAVDPSDFFRNEQSIPPLFSLQ